MTSFRIASAAGLVLSGEDGSPLAVQDDRVHAAFLDLRGEAVSVARAKLSAVAAALGPRLILQSDLRLLIAAGDLSVQEAARLVANSLTKIDAGDAPLVAIKGENLIGRLEELMQAGCELRQEVDSGEGGRLADETRSPISARTACGHDSILAALRTGARVLLSAHAGPGALLSAAACEALGEEKENWFDIDSALQEIARSPREILDLAEFVKEEADRSTPPREMRSIDIELPSGYRNAAVALGNEADAASLLGRGTASLPAGVQLQVRSFGEHLLLLVTASEETSLAQACERLALLCDPALEGPRLLEGFGPSRFVREPWRTGAPGGLLEFGHDCRPAREWAE